MRPIARPTSPRSSRSPTTRRVRSSSRRSCSTSSAAPRRWRDRELAGFAAVIFDMDGVLVDGEPLHFHAVNELLARDGRALTLDQYRPYMGTKSGWTEFIRDFGLERSKEYYAPRYMELILAQYRQKSVPLP